MSDRFDLVIVGSGTAARAAAARAHAARWRIAIVDQLPLGGTCALRGCDPKRVLIGAAEIADAAKRMPGIVGDLSISWPDLMRFKRTFTDPVPEQHRRRYAEQGIEAMRGVARFIGPDRLDVDGRALEARRILLACGARPMTLRIPGEEHMAFSDQFLEFERLPSRIVFVGGGYIAAELAHLSARAGAAATILEAEGRMLANFDEECVAWLMERFETLGVAVRTKTPVRSIERTGLEYRVNTPEGSIVADLVVHAAGRAPALDGLDLAKGDVAVEKARLELNDFLQSETNPLVYAAGDVAQKGPPLTPVSAYDGHVAAENMLGAKLEPDYRGVASVAFTIPPIAAVGLTETQARQESVRIRVNTQRASSWFTARREAEPVYGYKVIVDEDTDLMLGAHLVGPHVDETINLFALAIRSGLTTAQMREALFSYPTGASDIASMLSRD